LEPGVSAPLDYSCLVNVEDLVNGVIAGDRRAVARAISMVEDGADGLAELSAGLYPHTSTAYTIGLTGSPGVGKSSLAAQLVQVVRQLDLSIAVLAIDPTSPFTGGALLGDRLRMQSHATDPAVFIRSMATRGHLGGMALAAPEAVRILDASGKDIVVVETVGVGQAEVEVAHATDTTLVVVSPGWGDAVQVAKAGILEIADVFVVNKSDKEGAGEAARDLRHMLKMGAEMEWTPPVVQTSAATGEGIDELWDAIEGHRKHLESTGRGQELRRARLLAEVEELVSQTLKERARTILESDEDLGDDLLERRTDPYRAVGMLVERVQRGSDG
jgi:GTPase